ncbi:MAG: EamA family transporter [Syntrophobacteraceae bacterium]|jgi:undecaprenyl phosphate-alpha-L-ara4N flippase subunit ArnE
MPYYPELAVILLATFSVAAGHLVLKKSSLLPGSRKSTSYILAVLAALLMGVGPLGAIYVLRKVPLTLAVPMGALIYVLVPLGARLFFHEKLNGRFWAGLALVIAGIVIIGLSKTQF